MARSVVITTPIPTLEETVERYRLSKADQRLVAGLFEDKRIGRQNKYAFRARVSPSKTVKNKTGNASGVARKSKNRVAEAA